MKSASPFRLFCLSLSGLMEAAASLAILGTLLGFAGRLAWWADLFSHFRVQYSVGLIVLGILLFVLRRKKWGMVCLGFCSLNLLGILPLFFSRNAPSDKGEALSVMLINVNSSTGDPERVLALVQRESPDVLVLQEITSAWVKDLALLEDLFPYREVRSRSDNFGIGLYSLHPFSESGIVSIGRAGVPSVTAGLQYQNDNIHLLATHPLPPFGGAYSHERNDQLLKLPEHVDSTKPSLLIGDLNTTPWSYTFRDLLKQTGLQNSMKGFGIQPTWPMPNLLFGIPLDHVLHSDHFQMVDRRTGPSVGSDHSPVIVELQWKDHPGSR